ncbi:MAG: FHA domain-containing protein [Planctomycetes bacterium]|nr:FHA domain-containing protein [Planctomycetota bacterium]MBI3844146.1 FHA domain-containing protein [Planctomycetota bacterium]
MSDPKKPKKQTEAHSRTVVSLTAARPDLHLVPAELDHIEVEVVGGPMDGYHRRLSSAAFTIGRGEKNDLALPLDDMVSTAHARIVKEGEHYWLEDLYSRNGTFVGDKRIKARVLIATGALFVVGRTCIEFMPS